MLDLVSSLYAPQHSRLQDKMQDFQPDFSGNSPENLQKLSA